MSKDFRPWKIDEAQRGDEMPDWVADKQKRLEKICQVKAELEAEAKAAAEAEMRRREEEPQLPARRDNALRMRRLL